MLSLLYGPTLTSIHDHRKNHSFDYTDLCWQSNVWFLINCLGWSSHGQRSLVGCTPCGREESDMTDQLHFHFSLSCIGEENGDPLQSSCLKNPRDGGAWWAAIYGVAESQTRLKRLSSSSSRLVIALLPRSNCLLISWLQSPSAVILEPRKVSHSFHCFPIYLPWNDGTRCHDLSFPNDEFKANF